MTNNADVSFDLDSDKLVYNDNGTPVEIFFSASGTGGGSVTPAALTKTDDTNVTLTLGGTPSTALLQSTSITAGWAGQLSISRGGTGQSTASAALNALFPSQSGQSGKFATTDGTNISWGTPSGGGGGSGAILQVVGTTYATNADLTTVIPADDTTPTSSEGTQILSQAITPADNTNKVLVHGVLNIGMGGTEAAIAAVFRGTTCIGVFSIPSVSTSVTFISFPFTILDSPSSASSQTYSVRIGPQNTFDPIRANGKVTGRLYGGASACSLILQEVNA